MKTKKYKIQILVEDHNDHEIYSIIQVMSTASLGNWIKYFVVEQHDRIKDIKFITNK